MTLKSKSKDEFEDIEHVDSVEIEAEIILEKDVISAVPVDHKAQP